MSRSTFTLIAAAVVSMLSLASADAALIGLQKKFPDVFSNAISVGYDATTDAFVANGVAKTIILEDGGDTYNINFITFLTDPAKFVINATIDSSGNASAGSILIRGKVTIDAVVYSGDLLKGTLFTSEFGYQDNGGDIFEFVFELDPTSLLAPFWNPNLGDDNHIEVILDANFNNAVGSTPFTGSFASNFNNYTNGNPSTNPRVGVADTFIPEPTSAGLTIIVAAAGLLRRRVGR
jgi:hypothetical protein